MHQLDEIESRQVVELVGAWMQVLAHGMTDLPATERDSAIQAVQMLGADEHRSVRIVDA